MEQCLKAVEDCGAPIVSICGGEPMIYPRWESWCRDAGQRKKYIYLCTNGMFIKKRLGGVQAVFPVLLQRPH